MKKILTATILAAAALATPAMASDFTGPRAEVRLGFSNLDLDAGNNRVNADGVTYGVAVGYDVQVLPRVIAGIDLAVDNTSSDKKIQGVLSANAKRDLEASARLGYVLGDSVLVYGRLGYSNLIVGTNVRDSVAGGLRYGGGVEVAITKNIFTKAEYRVTKYDSNTQNQQGLVGLGVRF